MYTVRGRSAATGGAAAIGDGVFNFWNPHSTQIIKLRNFIIVGQSTVGGALGAYCFNRTSARGTPGSTVTPNISNHHRHAMDPPSGALLDLADFTVQPTLVAGDMEPIVRNIAAPAPIYNYSFGNGLYIPPGSGLALVHLTTSSAPIYEITLTWGED